MPGSAGSIIIKPIAIPGLKHYSVSNKGDVFSSAKGLNKLATHVNKFGYAYISLKYRSGVRKRFTVHRLVLTTFIGPRPTGYDACHNNGIRTDNNIQNLRWDTRKGNFRDKIKHGTLLQGESHGQAKLNELQVRIIRRCTDIEDSFLSEFFKISRRTAQEIKKHLIWKHLPDNQAISKRSSLIRISKKMNVIQVRIIRRCTNVPNRFLGKVFNCCNQTAWEIKNGHIWSSV